MTKGVRAPGVFDSGGGVRKKFLLAVLMTGLLPLLFLVYLGLPVLLPSTVTAPLSPKGAPVFVALFVFLAFIELAGFYIIYSDVLGHMRRSNIEHRAIFDAIAAGDPARARAAAEQHVLSGRTRLLANFEEPTRRGNPVR